MKKNKMKKLLLITFIFLSTTTYSQIYVGIMGTTQGVGLTTGVVAKSGVEISIGYNTPISRKVTVPTLFYFKGGYEYLLSKKEENNYTLTPSFGMAYWFKEDISKWNNGGEIKSEKDLKLILTLELGKNINDGRIFINTTYCGNLFAGVGIRAFFK